MVSSNSEKRRIPIASAAVTASETMSPPKNSRLPSESSTKPSYAPPFRGMLPPDLALFSAWKGGDRIATKEEKLELEGEIVEAFPNGMFKVALDNGHDALGYTAGKMRRYRIKIFPGDRVKLELSPYDLSRGRIVYRYK